MLFPLCCCWWPFLLCFEVVDVLEMDLRRSAVAPTGILALPLPLPLLLLLWLGSLLVPRSGVALAEPRCCCCCRRANLSAYAMGQPLSERCEFRDELTWPRPSQPG